MATAKTMTDASTSLNAANLNKFVTHGGHSGTTVACAVWGCRVRYNAGWEVVTDEGYTDNASGIVLTWSGTYIDLGFQNLTNQFSVKPACIVSPFNDDIATSVIYTPKAYTFDKDHVRVSFYNTSNTRQGTQSASMDFSFIVFGEIG